MEESKEEIKNMANDSIKHIGEDEKLDYILESIDKKLQQFKVEIDRKIDEKFKSFYGVQEEIEKLRAEQQQSILKNIFDKKIPDLNYDRSIESGQPIVTTASITDNATGDTVKVPLHHGSLLHTLSYMMSILEKLNEFMVDFEKKNTLVAENTEAVEQVTRKMLSELLFVRNLLELTVFPEAPFNLENLKKHNPGEQMPRYTKGGGKEGLWVYSHLYDNTAAKMTNEECDRFYEKLFEEYVPRRLEGLYKIIDKGIKEREEKILSRKLNNKAKEQEAQKNKGIKQ